MAMKNIHTRLVIYPKDVELITGRSKRFCQVTLQRVKRAYNKQKKDFVTIDEFCAVMKMKEELVRKYLT